MILSKKFGGRKIEVGFSCGRSYLEIDGLVVAMEGDMCRDMALTYEFSSNHWNEKMLKAVADRTEAKRVSEVFEKSLDRRFSSLSDKDSEAKYIAAKKRDRDEWDAEVKRLFSTTVAAVECNSNEHLELWSKYANDSRTEILHAGRPVYTNKVSWKQVGRGIWQQIGELRVNKENLPIAVSCNWDIIDGHPILFYECTSRLQDTEKTEQWIREQVPKDCVFHDAMNFHNAILAVCRKNGKDHL